MEKMKVDENLARLRMHGNNIHRYRRLLATNLTDFERGYVERRLQEEQSAFELLTPFVLQTDPASSSKGTAGYSISILDTPPAQT